MNELLPVIGIDFGTSNSKMAWYNPKTGQAEILKNDEGEDQTPSVVYFDDNEILVGKPALELLEDEKAWDRVIISIKRAMVKSPMLNLAGRTVKAVEVAAAILRKLKHDAEELHFQREVPCVVITYPASFDGLEQDKIREAAKLAGFREVELLAEPVAAAYAYARMGLKVGNYVLVYDMGGGTFDLTVLGREDNGMFFLVLPPQGIKHCGGDDFDEALYNHCDTVCQEKLGRPISLTGRRDLRFLRQCRERKENLTKQERRSFSSLLEPGSSGGPVRFQYEIDRTTFEELIRAQVEETVQHTIDLLEQANASGYQVDTVVLIGGSSRVPLIEALLKKNLPMEPLRWQNQGLAVAFGAAYHAHSRWNPDKTPQYRRAVQEAWAGKKLESVEQLNLLALRLGLSKNQAATVEREVMGDSKEAILARQARDDGKGGVLVGQAEPVEIEPVTTPEVGKTEPVTAPEVIKLKPRPKQDKPKSDPITPAKPARFLPTFTIPAHSSWVNSIAISPDNHVLASSSEDMTIRLWDLHTGRLIYSLDGYAGWITGVRSIAISPDGHFLASGGADQTVKLWDIHTGKPLYTFSGHVSRVYSVVFSPQGGIIASGSDDRTIKVWNRYTGALLHTFIGHLGGVSAVAISPDAHFLASGSDDNTIRLWDLRTGRQLRILPGHSSAVLSLAISPDGQTLVSGSGDKTVRLWNPHSGVLLHTLPTHADLVYSIALRPDRPVFASATAYGVITLWNLHTGEAISTLGGAAGWVRSLAFSPDGQVFAAGTAEGTIKVWKRVTG